MLGNYATIEEYDYDWGTFCSGSAWMDPEGIIDWFTKIPGTTARWSRVFCLDQQDGGEAFTGYQGKRICGSTEHRALHRFSCGVD